MAQAFGSLTRHIIGSVFCIGSKIVIDNNCNILIPNSTLNAMNGIFSNDVTVCGTMFADFLEPKDNSDINIDGVLIGNGDLTAKTINANTFNVFGNLCTTNVKTDYLFENTPGHNIVFQNDANIEGNLSITNGGNLCAPIVHTNYLQPKAGNEDAIELVGNLKVSPKLFVDSIMELTPLNGVCIGPAGGNQIIATTVNDAATQGNVTGDATWQSFDLPVDIKLSKIEVHMCRLTGFTNTPMEARIWEGVGTGGLLVGSVCVPSYNGGIINFSSLNLCLTAGTYTLQMDYPPSNVSNYTWFGHMKVPGDPAGSASNLTLHLTVCATGFGGLKVTAFDTCVENTLKLQFNDCDVRFVGANIDANVGACGNGLMDIELKCDGNIFNKTISFDCDGTIIQNLSDCEVKLIDANVDANVGTCGNGQFEFEITCDGNVFTKTIPFDGPKPKTEINRLADLPIVPDIAIVLPFENEVLDVTDMWDVSDAGNVVISQDGCYMLSADVSWEGNTTGNYRTTWITSPGLLDVRQQVAVVTSNLPTCQNLSTIKQLSAGDVVQIRVEHDGAGNVEVQDARFTVARVQ